MNVKELRAKIDSMLASGELEEDSPVTAHLYVRGGVAIEWPGKDIEIECRSKYGDGLEFNINGDISCLVYMDKYDTPSERQSVCEKLKNFKLINGEPYLKPQDQIR